MSNIKAQIVDFLNDFDNAYSRAFQMMLNILESSDSVGAGALPAMAYIAIAEVYGSMQLTIGTDAQGNYNKSDVMVFMKNIGGDQKK
jgi:hypothetical protein